jgi:hypothetical protein
MARIRYKAYKPGVAARNIIAQANAICAEYAAQGYDLTLRQLFYQFVSRDIIRNSQNEYSRLGDIVGDARMAGMLDWDYITDRTRNLVSNNHWDTPNSIMRGAARSFMLDRWDTQPTRVEVWVEKEALASVVQRAAERFDCAWFACRGYTSQSEMWAAGQRLGGYVQAGQDVVILHLGDHDPSGIDMTRDIEDRLRKFIFTDYAQANADDLAKAYGEEARKFGTIGKAIEEWLHFDRPNRTVHGWGGIEVNRIALNMDQIEEYEPPPNPAKFTDSRAEKYVAEYGTQSWELDALPPDVLDTLITDHIDRYVDIDLYNEAVEAEDTHTELLNKAAERWAEVVEFLESEETA